MVSAVYSLFLRLLVQTALWGFQVSIYMENYITFCSGRKKQKHVSVDNHYALIKQKAVITPSMKLIKQRLVTELKTCYCLHIALSPPCSLSPPQEWQFIPLLCLLLRLYLSVWSSRPTNYWHHWLGNMVSILCFYWFCTSVSLHWISTTLSLFCFASGWIAALTGLNTSIPVGIIMLLIAALFTALSVGSLIMFKKVTQS